MTADTFSRPATLDDLKTLIRSLNEQKVDYLLIGGYALYAHGYHRATTDIDLLLPNTHETGKRLQRALMVLPDKSAANLDLAWFEEGENIRLADAFVVDILFRASGETYETLLPYVETIELDGVSIRTVNLEGLLRTKLSSRDKDASDRAILERALLELKKK
jgi:predicted nucleotidyltransferase